jgi:hypothetical protein
MSIKKKIEGKIEKILDEMDRAAPAELNSYARAIAALASALSEVSGGSAQGLATLIEQAKVKESENE